VKGLAFLATMSAVLALHKAELFGYSHLYAFDRGKSYDDILHKHRKHKRGRHK